MLKAIVAHDLNRVIGNGINIPWHIKDELKHFKNTTTGHTIIYGSTTYKSIGRALPNRHNIVISRNKEFKADGCEVINSLDYIVDRYENSDDVAFVCGGASIYKQLLPYCSELIVSIIKNKYEGDVLFPEYEDKFDLVNEEDRGEFVVKYFKRKAA